MPGGLPVDGIRNWTSGWLPAMYEGTQIRSEGTPVFESGSAGDVPAAARLNQLRFLNSLNPRSSRDPCRQLGAGCADSKFLKLRARMQTAVTDVLDLSHEPDHVKHLYGLDQSGQSHANYAEALSHGPPANRARGTSFRCSHGQLGTRHDKNAEKLRGLCR